MDRRIEEEILAELALTSKKREGREMAQRILRVQETLRRHADDRAWRAFLAFEEMTGDRNYHELLRAIHIAFRRGLCTSRDDLLERR
jgi:midasin (ATPase involved in ribosome maturation)